jgi:hypothetical protein
MPIVIVFAGDHLALDRLEATLNQQLGAITPDYANFGVRLCA